MARSGAAKKMKTINSKINWLGVWFAVGNCGAALLFYLNNLASVYQSGERDMHVHGADCFTVGETNFTIAETCCHLPSSLLFGGLLNYPAIVAAKILTAITSVLLPQMCVYAAMEINDWATILFVAVQWLSISYAINFYLNKRKLN